MDIVLTQAAAEYILGVPNASEREQIQSYMDRQAELAHRLNEPVSKTLRDDIHELRPGPHRLLFIYHRHKIVILHAFRKKTRKTPERELLAAIHARIQYLQG